MDKDIQRTKLAVAKGGWAKQIKVIMNTLNLDEHWATHRIVESAYCPLETNVTLHVNYIWIKKEHLIGIREGNLLVDSIKPCV